MRNWIIGATLAGVTATGGAYDAMTFTGKTPVVEKADHRIAGEDVAIEQKQGVVETRFPWKGEPGLTIKYDLNPTLSERVADRIKRDVITEVVDYGEGGFKLDILLTEKPDTNRFCYQVEGAENYDFFYQPALTEKEIADGMQRPEDIVGSYAVYHKQLRNHKLGEMNYATGKVMHIPYPYIWEVNDESTKHRAEDFSYEDGSLCVTASQAFLDAATYPVRIDPTFGYTSLGASRLAIGYEDPDISEVYAVQRGDSKVLGEDGTLTTLSAGLSADATSQATDFFIALYREDSAGSGSHDLVVGLERTDLSITTSNAWYDFTASDEALTADTYVASAVANGSKLSLNTAAYIALDGPLASHNIYQESAVGGSSYTTRKSEDPWTEAATVSTFNHYSIYATYSTPAADPETSSRYINNGRVQVNNGRVIIGQ